MRFVDAISGFSVADLDKAKEFYGGTLGLDVSTNEMGILDLKLPGGGHGIIYPKPDHQPATFTVLNLVVDDIDASVDDLTAAGVVMEHYDQPEMTTNARGIVRNEYGPAIAWFKDPAGNIISVIQQS